MNLSIFDDGCQFDFFEAMNVLERLYPDREPIGRDAHPTKEVVRIGAHLTLQFPASEIQSVEPGKGEDPQPRMRVNFLGLTGPSGVLPIQYTELLLSRRTAKDPTLQDFLDLFNHRLTSLFYRAWWKYRYHMQYEEGGRDEFSHYLSDFSGMGTPGLQGRSAVRDEALLFYTGLFGQHPHGASALEGILRDYFEVPVEVVQFIGRWVKIGPENENRLGVRNCELGLNLICGPRVWERQSKFRVRIGPLDLETFRMLLPCGSGFRPLTELARLFAGTEYDLDVQLVVKAPQVPELELRSDGAKEGAHLGWSSWLKTREFTRDAEDSVISCAL